jgi:hypothetical protein
MPHQTLDNYTESPLIVEISASDQRWQNSQIKWELIETWRCVWMLDYGISECWTMEYLNAGLWNIWMLDYGISECWTMEYLNAGNQEVARTWQPCSVDVWCDVVGTFSKTSESWTRGCSCNVPWKVSLSVKCRIFREHCNYVLDQFDLTLRGIFS